LERTARAATSIHRNERFNALGKPEVSKIYLWLHEQKFTIADRVQRRGSQELSKVLEFIGRASEALQEIDRRLELEEVDEEEG